MTAAIARQILWKTRRNQTCNSRCNYPTVDRLRRLLEPPSLGPPYSGSEVRAWDNSGTGYSRQWFPCCNTVPCRHHALTCALPKRNFPSLQTYVFRTGSHSKDRRRVWFWEPDPPSDSLFEWDPGSQKTNLEIHKRMKPNEIPQTSRVYKTCKTRARMHGWMDGWERDRYRDK